MRYKYRSAIYWFNEAEKQPIESILNELQLGFDQPLITQILPFVDLNRRCPNINIIIIPISKPFCQVYINPKLQLLQEKLSIYQF